ncbi:hypothetical protein FRC07_009828, partial [Ceratobasidium sp. 392]
MAIWAAQFGLSGFAMRVSIQVRHVIEEWFAQAAHSAAGEAKESFESYNFGKESKSTHEMLFGRNLITLIVSGMATLAIAAPLKTAIPSTGDLIIREERVSKDASRSLNTILSGAHSDFGSILSQLEALDFKNDGSRSVEQISGQFQDIFLGVVNNFAKLAQTH